MIYPGSAPEFRILVLKDGTNILQCRYINITQGYVSAWASVPAVKEEELNNESPTIKD